MGALKAGATVSVLDPQYPPERQKILLDVANPRFLVCIDRANVEFGKPSDTVLEFISSNLKIKATIPALELQDDGELKGGLVDGKDCIEDQYSLKERLPTVQVGPDSAPTLSFTSGSEGRPKGVKGRHFSLTYYFPWMAERFGLSEDDRFTMLSGIAHDPIQVCDSSSDIMCDNCENADEDTIERYLHSSFPGCQNHHPSSRCHHLRAVGGMDEGQQPHSHTLDTGHGTDSCGRCHDSDSFSSKCFLRWRSPDQEGLP
jgi:hypothetical protein